MLTSCSHLVISDFEVIAHAQRSIWHNEILCEVYSQLHLYTLSCWILGKDDIHESKYVSDLWQTYTGSRNPRTAEGTQPYDERKCSRPLPKARYLLKLAEEQRSNATVTSYIVRLLQQQGMECVVEKGHIVVSADETKLKSQARYFWLLTFLVW